MSNPRDLLLQEGSDFYSNGNYEEAMGCYDKILNENPLDVDALNCKAGIFLQLGRYEEGIKYCDKVLEIDPRYARALNNKGIALEDLQRYENAIECYNKALEIDPRYDKALYNKGNALGRLGRHVEAIECFDKALEIDPNYAKASYSKGYSLAKLGKKEESIEWFDKSLKIEPQNVDALISKSLVFSKLNRNEEARECYNKALEIDPEHVNKLYGKNFGSKPLTQMKDIVKTWKFWEKRKEPYYINDLLTRYFTTLNEQSISIILQYFAKHNIILTGDANLLVYLSEESREQRARMIPFKVICGDSKMKGHNLKENVIQPLVSELEQSLRLECRGIIRDSSGSVEFFKDNEWQECVRIATKGYSIDQ